jgi:hypothetical protein
MLNRETGPSRDVVANTAFRIRKLLRSLRRRFFGVVLVVTASGCQSVAPIHVWVPPKLQSAVGRKVAIAPIVGDQKIAGPLHAAMIAHAPRDQGRSLQCLDARALHANQTIRLVSAVEGETSDIADLAQAKRQGIDFLLTGTLLQQPREARRGERQDQRPGQLAVSWKLVDVHGKHPVTGFPIVTRHDTSLDPDAIATAAAEDAWRLITPHVTTSSINLAVPRLLTGSSRVRRGNAAAEIGDWMTAQEIWQQAVRVHPNNHAALHNLAIAAVARQDFDEAHRFIGEAVRRGGRSLYRETAVWIEARQREYHQAFGLPDPVHGWSATRR